LEKGFFARPLVAHALSRRLKMKRRVWMLSKGWVACGVLCAVACKKDNREPALPSASEMLQKMTAREKALSSFSIQVHTTEKADVTVEHTLTFRAPDFVRADVTQPQKLVLSFDGQNHYRLEDAAKKLTVLNLHLPTVERRLALSMLMGAFVPEGFQLPRVVPQGLKQSWLASEGSSRVLRLENHVRDGGEAATVAYVVRWPSLDFLKKEFFVDGKKQIEFAMQEEQCMLENKVCVPTRIAAKQNGTELAPQKTKLLSFQEAVSNEHFVLQAPEGFAVERHSISSLKELERCLH
jgi:hypothetical protein